MKAEVTFTVVVDNVNSFNQAIQDARDLVAGIDLLRIHEGPARVSKVAVIDEKS